MAEIRKITEEEFRAYLEENYIAYKLWCCEDIANELVEAGYADSEENIGEVLNAGVGGLHDCTDDDWQIIQNAIFYAAQNHDLALSDKTVENALEMIREYYDNDQIGPMGMESMTDAEIFPDVRDIGLAHTDVSLSEMFDDATLEDLAFSSENKNAEFPVQVSLDLTARTVTTTVNDVVVKSITHRTTEDLLDYLANLEFTSLTSLWNEPKETQEKIAFATSSLIKEASDLILKAAELGIMNMPDENHVLIAWEFEDGTQGWRNERFLSAAIGLANEPENVELLKETIQQKEQELEKQKTVKTSAELLAEHIVANRCACPVSESASIPGCQCWGSEMCVKCIIEHSNKLK